VKLNNPAEVARQYAGEQNLEARRSIYDTQEGPDPRQVAFDAIAEAAPQRVLEVGGGPGELAARLQDELGCEVVMVDVAPRMVELATERGVDAQVGDAQALPFPDKSFDVAVAAWMLYHVPDLDQALSELARVLRPGGRLVAVTNGIEHLSELRRIAGVAMWQQVFRSEEAVAHLAPHFDSVERRDAEGWVTVDDDDVVRAYVASLQHDGEVELAPYELPLRIRRSSSIFVAEKAA
jgi:ubiquinone/menaquinone biosynthesis C-methylase UbiE